jgi:hypothetical protein
MYLITEPNQGDPHEPDRIDFLISQSALVGSAAYLPAVSAGLLGDRSFSHFSGRITSSTVSSRSGPCGMTA